MTLKPKSTKIYNESVTKRRIEVRMRLSSGFCVYESLHQIIDFMSVGENKTPHRHNRVILGKNRVENVCSDENVCFDLNSIVYSEFQTKVV